MQGFFKKAKPFWLYRFIDLGQLVSLIKTNSLKARVGHSFPRGMTPGISFTRNPNMNYMRFSSSPIRLVVNGNTLEQKHEIHAYSDFAHYWNQLKDPENVEKFSRNPKLKDDMRSQILSTVQESEEFVEGTITQAFSYIERIDINLSKLYGDTSFKEVFSKLHERLRTQANKAIKISPDNPYLQKFLKEYDVTFEDLSDPKEGHTLTSEFYSQQKHYIETLPLVDAYIKFIRKALPADIKLNFIGEEVFQDYATEDFARWAKDAIPTKFTPKRLKLVDEKEKSFPRIKTLPDSKGKAGTCFFKVRSFDLQKTYIEVDKIYSASDAENATYFHNQQHIVFKISLYALANYYKKVDTTLLKAGENLEVNLKIPYTVLQAITEDVIAEDLRDKKELLLKMPNINIKTKDRKPFEELSKTVDDEYNWSRIDEDEYADNLKLLKALKNLPSTLYWYPNSYHDLGQYGPLDRKIDLYSRSHWDNDTWMEVQFDSDVLLDYLAAVENHGYPPTHFITKQGGVWTVLHEKLSFKDWVTFIKKATFTNVRMPAGFDFTDADFRQLKKLLGNKLVTRYERTKIL